MRGNLKWLGAFFLGLLLSLGTGSEAFSAASIWDNDSAGWTTTFADGDPVDTGNNQTAATPELAVDSNGILYIVYTQDTGGTNRVYLAVIMEPILGYGTMTPRVGPPTFLQVIRLTLIS